MFASVTKGPQRPRAGAVELGKCWLWFCPEQSKNIGNCENSREWGTEPMVKSPISPSGKRAHPRHRRANYRSERGNFNVTSVTAGQSCYSVVARGHAARRAWEFQKLGAIIQPRLLSSSPVIVCRVASVSEADDLSCHAGKKGQTNDDK